MNLIIVWLLGWIIQGFVTTWLNQGTISAWELALNWLILLYSWPYWMVHLIRDYLRIRTAEAEEQRE